MPSDSIQTIFSDELDSLPGSISQVRECGQQLLQLSKQKGIAVIIIGAIIAYNYSVDTTKQKGSGLGLSIVNKIINDHNGTLKVLPNQAGAEIKIKLQKDVYRNFNNWW